MLMVKWYVFSGEGKGDRKGGKGKEDDTDWPYGWIECKSISLFRSFTSTKIHLPLAHNILNERVHMSFWTVLCISFMEVFID